MLRKSLLNVVAGLVLSVLGMGCVFADAGGDRSQSGKIVVYVRPLEIGMTYSGFAHNYQKEDGLLATILSTGQAQKSLVMEELQKRAFFISRKPGIKDVTEKAIESRDQAIKATIQSQLKNMVVEMRPFSYSKSIERQISTDFSSMPYMQRKSVRLVATLEDSLQLDHPGSFGKSDVPWYEGKLVLVYAGKLTVYDPNTNGKIDIVNLKPGKEETDQPIRAYFGYGWGIGKRDDDPRPEAIPSLMQSLSSKLPDEFSGVPWQDYLQASKEMSASHSGMTQ